MPRRRQADRLVVAAHTKYRDKTAAVRHTTQARLRARWRALPDYRDAAAQAYAVEAARTVEAGRTATAALTAAFIVTVGTAAGHQIRPPALVLGAGRGVPAQEQWMRPAQEVWSRLGDGKPLTQAINAGLTRAETMAATDLQLAKIDTVAEVMQGEDSITGYQRVTGANPCDLCESVAGEYLPTDEMSLHDNCSCDAVPTFGGVRWTDLATERPTDPAPTDTVGGEGGPRLVPQ